ncbi:MAG: CBS domain-containing protein [Thermoproteota archaeon]
MTKGVLTLDKDATVWQAAKAMTELKIGSLLVTEKDWVVGIITERDILSKVVADKMDPTTVKVSEVMSSSPVSVEADQQVSEALKTMAENGVKHLVVRDEGEAVGMFSLANLVDLERYTLMIG